MWVFSPQKSLGCPALRSLRTLPRDDQELGPGHWRARFRWQSGSRRRNGGDRHHVSKSSCDSSRQRHHAGIAASTTTMISTHIASAIAISRVTISNSPGWPDISAVLDSSWRVELGKRRPSIPMQGSARQRGRRRKLLNGRSPRHPRFGGEPPLVPGEHEHRSPGLPTGRGSDASGILLKPSSMPEC